jgi:hypothetical protein
MGQIESSRESCLENRLPGMRMDRPAMRLDPHHVFPRVQGSTAVMLLD